MKTLVISSHPYPEQSKVNRALKAAAAALPGVTVRDLEALYGNDVTAFDVAAEQQAYADADRVVFLFPIHWFNLTPMLKAYLNVVWSYGWAFGPGGEALKGKEFQMVVSAGGTEQTYSADSFIHATMEDVLTPIRATAVYVGMNYLPALALHSANGVSDEALDAFRAKFIEKLSA